jgi:hypothetical protein
MNTTIRLLILLLLLINIIIIIYLFICLSNRMMMTLIDIAVIIMRCIILTDLESPTAPASPSALPTNQEKPAKEAQRTG